MLHLLVRLENDAFAIETARVHRVVPFARLKSLPSGLAEVAGILNYHGQAVPVIDLTLLLTGAPSREALGTRIVLTEVELPGGGTRLLGLLVEGAHSVARFDPTSFQPSGLRPDDRPWLGPVVEREQMLVQRIDVADLLPRKVLEALLHDSASALSA